MASGRDVANSGMRESALYYSSGPWGGLYALRSICECGLDASDVLYSRYGGILHGSGRVVMPQRQKFIELFDFFSLSYLISANLSAIL